MSISAIGAVGGIAPPSVVTPTTGAAGSGGVDFATALGNGLDHLQGLQDKADNLSVQAATGSLTDVHDYMIASTEASLATELTVAVRNKAIDAFNEIMRMQA